MARRIEQLAPGVLGKTTGIWTQKALRRWVDPRIHKEELPAKEEYERFSNLFGLGVGVLESLIGAFVIKGEKLSDFVADDGVNRVNLGLSYMAIKEVTPAMSKEVANLRREIASLRAQLAGRRPTTPGPTPTEQALPRHPEAKPVRTY